MIRDMKNAVIGGVCSGLGKYLGVDPVLVRVGFCVSVVVFGIGILPYLILWLLMPVEES